MLPRDEADILDEAAGPVVAADVRGRIAYLNHAATALLGWTPEEADGQPLTLLMPARMHEAHREGIRRYTATHQSRLMGKAVRVPALRKDGTEVDIELMLRMFRRPDGTGLILGLLRELAPGAPSTDDVIELESQLEKRAYQLV
jgi:PAS domain S-box-containing protein